MHVNQSLDLHVLTEIDHQKSKWLGSYISYTIALRHFLYILFSSTIYPMGSDVSSLSLGPPARPSEGIFARLEPARSPKTWGSHITNKNS